MNRANNYRFLVQNVTKGYMPMEKQTAISLIENLNSRHNVHLDAEALLNKYWRETSDKSKEDDCWKYNKCFIVALEILDKHTEFNDALTNHSIDNMLAFFVAQEVETAESLAVVIDDAVESFNRLQSLPTDYALAVIDTVVATAEKLGEKRQKQVAMISWPQEHFEVVSDTRNVWVNSSSGVCVGRFTKHGVDIHADAEGQLQGKHCLECFNYKQQDSRHAWDKFVAGMQQHYGVLIPSSAMPYHVY